MNLGMAHTFSRIPRVEFIAFACGGNIPSAAVPVAHPPLSGAPGLAFSRLSAASPGRAFAPLSDTGLVFGQAGTSSEIYVS